MIGIILLCSASATLALFAGALFGRRAGDPDVSVEEYEFVQKDNQRLRAVNEGLIESRKFWQDQCGDWRSFAMQLRADVRALAHNTEARALDDVTDPPSVGDNDAAVAAEEAREIAARTPKALGLGRVSVATSDREVSPAHRIRPGEMDVFEGDEEEEL